MYSSFEKSVHALWRRYAYATGKTSTLYLYVYLVLKARARRTSPRLKGARYTFMCTSFLKRVHDALRLKQQDAVGASVYLGVVVLDILECIYFGNLHAPSFRV